MKLYRKLHYVQLTHTYYMSRLSRLSYVIVLKLLSKRKVRRFI
jgi:hypothetical protein